MSALDLPPVLGADCKEQAPPLPQRSGETRAARLLPTRVTGARALPQAHRPGNPSPLLINGKNVPRLSDGQRLIPLPPSPEIKQK